MFDNLDRRRKLLVVDDEWFGILSVDTSRVEKLPIEIVHTVQSLPRFADNKQVFACVPVAHHGTSMMEVLLLLEDVIPAIFLFKFMQAAAYLSI